MKLSFHGAAKTVTGSKHLLSLNNGKKILLDCGMFQGLGQETHDLNIDFGFVAKDINFLILSHAHIDHSGLIPKLISEGFTGKIYSTPATKELTEILLHDSAEIQTYETEHINKKRLINNQPPYEPLYNHEDVIEALSKFETIEYNEWRKIDSDIKIMFTNTGHLIGSASINLIIKENKKEIKVHFSGDVGRYRSVLLKPPATFTQADYIIMESTYGDKHHSIGNDNIEIIAKWINDICVKKGGKLIIPAFSVGRTQEVLYVLNQLELEKRLPDLHYFVDSPLSTKATSVIKKYTDQFNERLQKVLLIDDDPFAFKGLRYIEHSEDSKRLVEYDQPCVIISASGTADAGRVRHHISSSVEDAKNGILLVGFCSLKSLGGQLLEGCKEVELFGKEQKVKATVGKIGGMSAHGDTDDLCQFLECQDPEKVKNIFLVHGENRTQHEFSQKLAHKGFNKVTIPSQHESFELA